MARSTNGRTLLAKLNKHHLDFVRRKAGSMSDKKIAAELGIDVRAVRTARKKLGASKGGAAGRAAVTLDPAGASRQPGLAARFLAALSRFADHRVLVGLLLLALCLLLGYTAMLPIYNPDFGWHVALGRYIVENGTVPTTEPFTHTAKGAPMVAHEWLSQVIYYLVAEAGGILTLRWLHAGLAVAVLIILFLLLRRAGVSWALALLGTFLYMVIAQGRFHVRPHMFDLVFLMLMYGYVFVVKPALHWRQLLAIFVVTVVWVNMHSGVVLFAGLVVLYVAVETVQQKVGWRRPQPNDLGGGDLRRLGILAVVVLLALIVTPNHVRLFPYVLESKAINANLSREWLSIASYSPSDSIMKPFAVETFWIMAVATAGMALLTIRRQSLSVLAVVLFLGFLPLSGQRFVAVYFAPILFVLSEFSRWAGTKFGDVVPRGRALTHQLAMVLAIVVVCAVTYPALNEKSNPKQKKGLLSRYTGRLTPEWNFKPAVFPIGALSFLEEVHLEGRLFNSSSWGGYILLTTYDQYPIFIDGRWVTIGKDVFLDSRTIANRRRGTFEKLDQYNIEILLVHREWMTKKLQREQKWIPIFENFNAGLYLRDRPASAANLRRCAEYYEAYGMPFDMNKGFDEYAVFKANPEWAKDFRVERRHLKMGRSKMVAGW